MNDIPGRRQAGFTLIELLVVISIIAVLAAMLLPAIGIVRQLAQGVVCMNNLRQMTMASLGYAGENEGAIPGIGYGQNSFHWTVTVAPYLDAEYVWGSVANFTIRSYRCPANDPQTKPVSPTLPLNYATSYSIDQFSSVQDSVSYWRDAKLPKIIRLSTPKRSSEWRLFTEMSLTYGWWACDGAGATDQAYHPFPHRGLTYQSYLGGQVVSANRQTLSGYVNWNQ